MKRANVRRRGRTKRTILRLGLAENLDCLSTELGIDDLELEGTEVTVGHIMPTLLLGYRKMAPLCI